MIERVYYVEDAQKSLTPAPRPAPGKFQEMKYLARRVASIVGPHTPILREDFPELYQGRKKTVYANAVESLGLVPLSTRDSYLKTFVKAEKINFSAKPDPAPRVIQPRDPRFNVEVGKYLKPVEHHIYRALDKIWGGPTVMKGYTVDEVGHIIGCAWGQFRKPVAVGFDMKRFDQHVSVDALRFEHSIYSRIFHSPELDQLLSWQIYNIGSGFASDGMIKYRVEGCRMSGDMNTALGNCILACCIVKHITKGLKARLINNGDDCVLITEETNLAQVGKCLTQWLDFGFQCISEPPCFDIEEIEFCQMKPVYINGDYRMVRNPHISLAKDSYSIVPWNNTKSARKWASAVGQCGLALTSGIPLVQNYYAALLRNSNIEAGGVMESTAFASGFYLLAKRSLGRGFVATSEESRYSFYRAFGISPDAQVALEAHYDSLELNFEFTPYENQENECQLLQILKSI